MRERAARETVILPPREARSGMISELRGYHELLFFLTLRSVKVRYAQSALGIGWAVIQPLAQMLVFTIVFGELVGVETDGPPYAIFAFVALVPWTYFSDALSQGTKSLSTNSGLIGKVWFPRVILPLSEIGARTVDFAIAFVLLIILVLGYGIIPNASVVVLPLLFLIAVMSAAGISLFLSALSIQYRDVNYATDFGVRLLMYAAPVVYPYSAIPESWRLFYALNPMVGVIEGFRAALLSSRAMPWPEIGLGFAVAAALLVGGAAFFQRRQHLFADVV